MSRRNYYNEELSGEVYNSRSINDPLSVIYNQSQWRFSKVTALCNLQYNTVKLKQYATKIKQCIASSVAANSSIKYTVSVAADPNLKYSEDDPDAILIAVSTSVSEATARPKVVYEALLISWGLRAEVPDAVHLPYMLERGEQKLGAAVRNTLGTMFDCKIKQFHFTQNLLLYFGFNLLETETSNSDKNLGFSYTTPNVDHKDKLTLQFEIGDVCLIWKNLRDEISKKSEQVSNTYQMLRNQIFHMFNFDINALDLCEVNLPKATIKANGCIKVKTAEMVNCVFNVLNEICKIDD